MRQSNFISTLVKICAVGLCVGMALVTSTGHAQSQSNHKLINLRNQFDEAATKAGLQPGDATISGVVFSRTYYWGADAPSFGGTYRTEKVFPSRQKIYLYPYTPYLEEFVRQTRRVRNAPNGNEYKVVVDSRLYENSIMTESDANGRFTFTGLRPGRYLVYASTMLSGTVNQSVDTGGRTVSHHPYAGTVVTSHYVLRPVNWQSEAISEKVVEIKPRDRVVEVEARMFLNRR